MASKPLSGAAKRRKKKDLQNELKKRCKIDSFLLPAQTKKEETQSVANVRNEENEQEPQEDTRGSEVSELQIDTNSQVNSFKDNSVATDLSDHVFRYFFRQLFLLRMITTLSKLLSHYRKNIPTISHQNFRFSCCLSECQ